MRILLYELAKPHGTEHCNINALANGWEWMGSISDQDKIGAIVKPIAMESLSYVSGWRFHEKIKPLICHHQVSAWMNRAEETAHLCLVLHFVLRIDNDGACRLISLVFDWRNDQRIRAQLVAHCSLPRIQVLFDFLPIVEVATLDVVFALPLFGLEVTDLLDH